MKRCVLLTTLCIAWFVLLSWRSHLCAQETPKKTKPMPNPIEGNWTEVCRDMPERIMSMVPDSRPNRNGPTPGWYLWKISKKKIEMGPDIKDSFPSMIYACKLNPGGQADAIDLTLLDKDGRKGKHKKELAIYFVKDDYLMICGGDVRPKNFISSKDNNNWVYILRRSKR